MNFFRASILIWGLTHSFAHCLELGQNYDFFCSDGQDILNARLVDEDEKRYLVTLTASVQTISIERRFVMKISAVPAPVPARLPPPTLYVLGVIGGASFGTGRFAEFSSVGLTAGISVFRVTSHPIRLGIRAGASDFRRDYAKLQFYDFMAAIEYKVTQTNWVVHFRLGLATGPMFVYGTVTEQVVSGFVPAARGWLTIAYPVSAQLELSAQVGLMYVADKFTVLISPEVFLAGSYRL